MSLRVTLEALDENRRASFITAGAAVLLCTVASIISLYFWLSADPTVVFLTRISHLFDTEAEGKIERTEAQESARHLGPEGEEAENPKRDAQPVNVERVGCRPVA